MGSIIHSQLPIIHCHTVVLCGSNADAVARLLPHSTMDNASLFHIRLFPLRVLRVLRGSIKELHYKIGGEDGFSQYAGAGNGVVVG